jgi:hypothetical protein
MVERLPRTHVPNTGGARPPGVSFHRGTSRVISNLSVPLSNSPTGLVGVSRRGFPDLP